MKYASHKCDLNYQKTRTDQGKVRIMEIKMPRTTFYLNQMAILE